MIETEPGPRPEDLAIDHLRSLGHTGRNFDTLTRLGFADLVDDQFEQAERDCLGYLLNPAGEQRGIEPRSLFAGPWPRAKQWASPELLAWWAVNGRPTLAEYRAGLLGLDSRGVGSSRLFR